MVDAKAGKAIRVPESEAAYISDTPRLDMPPMPRHIPAAGTPTEAPSITVSQQHLDTNKHVNNAQYVMMAIDAFSALGYPFALHRIIVQYRRQAHLDDVIFPRVYQDEGGITVSLDSPEHKAYAIVRLEK